MSIMIYFTQAYCLKVKEMDDEEYEAAVSSWDGFVIASWIYSVLACFHNTHALSGQTGSRGG